MQKENQIQKTESKKQHQKTTNPNEKGKTQLKKPRHIEIYIFQNPIQNQMSNANEMNKIPNQMNSSGMKNF